ncbi:MAG: YcaQ family DNA glycosylase [Prolixibacteraceae bacterium]|nr:YcaQ family DNA glycosylase [Prolixibacteraceae bacterium]
MKTITISPENARNLAVGSQFDEKINSINGIDSLNQIFDQLGYVQIDTISVVNRAHHQALWSRFTNYSPEMLHELQAKERQVYEYWGHAMSYLPMKDFRFSLPRMEKFKKPKSPWVKYRIEQSKHIFKDIKKRIADEGPLSSKDFENTSGKKGGTWWDWKPAKMALEVLYWQGELMISERKNFQKYYDLTEKVLPEWVDTTVPDKNESARFIIKRALKAFGIATEKEIRSFLQPGAGRDSDFQLIGAKEINKNLKELIEEGSVVKIKTDSIPVNYFALSESINELKGLTFNNPGVKLLSPFDNLIIQRERAKQLFNFDYSLECYTPEPKRKYGYFVFPVLFGNNLVARFDPKADRKAGKMIIKNLVTEPEFIVSENFIELFYKEIKRFTMFHDCDKIMLEKCPDQKLKKELSLKFKSKII